MKVFSNLLNQIKLFNKLTKVNSTKVIIKNKSTIIVNGKNIDPESPEGKKILKESEYINESMKEISADMNELAEDLKHMFD